MPSRRTFIRSSVAAAALVGARVPAVDAVTGTTGTPSEIDREQVVRRHNVRRGALNSTTPLQVGNGDLALNVDVTGLQTFVPFNIMSSWGWWNAPLPAGKTVSDFHGEVLETHGRPVDYPAPDPAEPAISSWLYANPSRINLARIGMLLVAADGTTATIDDLSGIDQVLDLWTGIITSTFTFDGQQVVTETMCDPTSDTLGVRVRSPLLADRRLVLFIDFPFADTNEFADKVGNWNVPEAHATALVEQGPGRATIEHIMDATRYYAALTWSTPAAIEPPAPPPADSSLVILSARYGTGSLWLDVTALLTSMIVDGSSLTVDVSYRVLGDPAPGQSKQLEVDYTLGGAQHTVLAPDNTTLYLGPSLTAHRYTLGAAGGSELEVSCGFSPDLQSGMPGRPLAQVQDASTDGWRRCVVRATAPDPHRPRPGKVQIVGADSNWSVANDVAGDPAFADTVSVIAGHLRVRGRGPRQRRFLPRQRHCEGHRSSCPTPPHGWRTILPRSA